MGLLGQRGADVADTHPPMPFGMTLSSWVSQANVRWTRERSTASRVAMCCRFCVHSARDGADEATIPSPLMVKISDARCLETTVGCLHLA